VLVRIPQTMRISCKVRLPTAEATVEDADDIRVVERRKGAELLGQRQLKGLTVLCRQHRTEESGNYVSISPVTKWRSAGVGRRSIGGLGCGPDPPTGRDLVGAVCIPHPNSTCYSVGRVRKKPFIK